jgi:subtilisin family serine protease
MVAMIARGKKTTFVMLSALVAACSSAGSGGDDSELISNRSQTDRFFTAVMQLETPPLLETATEGPGGVLRIDPVAAQKIAEEQQKLIASLQKQSSEVRVVYKYRLLLNAVGIVAPRSILREVMERKDITAIDETTMISPPTDVPMDGPEARGGPFVENSVKWIGAKRAQAELGLRGRGVTVGVIDTGIDYTHKMFGGPGTVAAYANNDGAIIEPGTFPTRRVVGGKDFVGKGFDSSSPIEEKRIPHPDDDPIDEGGHGTHVAGTIGGIGDGVNTYDGVAPEVDLYALKVFGKGSTNEAAVIAALEFAADPNGDGDLSDRLDVVNLSLGSSWGTRLGLYSRVVTSLTRGGTLFVAAAGNAGASRYIVGSPSTSDLALSVAASTDNRVATTPADRLVGFSSWGPRSIDGALKPEVAAPGQNIISAKMGGGDKGTPKSGTSMASPHVAGVAALLRQARPNATPAELRSRIMNAGVAMKTANGDNYAVSKVGAGRVQTFESASAPIFFDPPALSLGIVAANAPQRGQRTIKVTNTSTQRVRAPLAFTATTGLTLRGPAAIDLAPGASADVAIDWSIDVPQANTVETELEGFITATTPSGSKLRVPALAVATRGSDITIGASRFETTSVSLPLSNQGPVDGDALAFAMLARSDIALDQFGACDLASAGYRIVKRPDGAEMLQFGFSLGRALSTWHFCELSVQFDANGDGVAEQELGGTFDPDLKAPASLGSGPFASFLIDAAKMRAVQARIEAGKAQPAEYLTTILDTQPYVRYAHSTIAYVSADLSKLVRTPQGKLRIKVGVLPASAGSIGDDFAGGDKWFEIDPRALPYRGFVEKVTAPSNASATVALRPGTGSSDIVVYLPHNRTNHAFIVSQNGETVALP